MKALFVLLAACILSLFAEGIAVRAAAQQVEQPVGTGADSTQLTPASAAPQTHAQPNLRTDSMPHTNQDASTDSGPAPETPALDATPSVDMGWDWSLAKDGDQPSVLKRIVTRTGTVSIVDVQTQGVTALPVTNPALPQSRLIADIPQPSVTHKPVPPDPLSGIAQ